MPTGGGRSDAAVHEADSEIPLTPVQVADYEAAGELLRALASPVRLALIDLLAAGPRCVHELVDALGVSQPLVSQHLGKLRAASLVRTQRRGREMIYVIADDHVAHVTRDAVAHAGESRE
ncbi:MAG: transcriptional regulator [Frankiales bacterium]|nr:transcriptional regulator [Frankiales bacterium]